MPIASPGNSQQFLGMLTSKQELARCQAACGVDQLCNRLRSIEFERAALTQLLRRAGMAVLPLLKLGNSGILSLRESPELLGLRDELHSLQASNSPDAVAVLVIAWYNPSVHRYRDRRASPGTLEGKWAL